jgi:hypothetical protein
MSPTSYQAAPPRDKDVNVNGVRRGCQPVEVGSVGGEACAPREVVSDTSVLQCSSTLRTRIQSSERPRRTDGSVSAAVGSRHQASPAAAIDSTPTPGTGKGVFPGM